MHANEKNLNKVMDGEVIIRNVTVSFMRFFRPHFFSSFRFKYFTFLGVESMHVKKTILYSIESTHEDKSKIDFSEIENRTKIVSKSECEI